MKRKYTKVPALKPIYDSREHKNFRELLNYSAFQFTNDDAFIVKTGKDENSGKTLRGKDFPEIRRGSAGLRRRVHPVLDAGLRTGQRPEYAGCVRCCGGCRNPVRGRPGNRFCPEGHGSDQGSGRGGYGPDPQEDAGDEEGSENRGSLPGAVRP